MNRFLCYLLISAFTFFCSCETKERPWNPIFEETGFSYLETSVLQAIGEINTLENHLQLDPASDNYKSLLNAKQTLLSLKEYYVPLTIVRQLVYDAGRFYYLKNTNEAEKRLNDARMIIEKMVLFFGSDDFGKVFEELIVMTDTCMMYMHDHSNQTFQSLENLGNKVNLMLVKGELELSGKTLN